MLQNKEIRLKEIQETNNNPRLKKSIKQKMEILKGNKTILK